MENEQLKILLVDDDRFLLDMYSMKFKKFGMNMEAVGSSVTALEKLRAGNIYDILIFDIIMPVMNGLELVETIKKEKLCPNAVTIILTNQSDDMLKARALGVNNYIVKATTIPSEVVEQVTAIYKKNKVSTA